MKKTICLVTNWYPSEKNPYAGNFFREQALALEEYFNFIVVHYYEHKKPVFGNTFFKEIKKEKNIVEYDVHTNVPILLNIYNELYNLWTLFTNRKKVECIGKYDSKARVKFTRRKLKKLYNNYLIDKFDVLYCVDAQTEAFYLQCLSEESSKPYIIGEHGPFPWPGFLISDTTKFAIEKADAFLAISNEKIKQILSQNIKLNRINYIGNLVDDKLFIEKKKNTDSIFNILIVAANSFYKNYDMFFKVMDELQTICKKQFTITICGYGANKGYSKDIDKLEKKVNELPYKDKFILIPEIKHDDLPSVLQKADVFVMTSILEGQPVAAIEAACCGIPIYSTKCGGVDDYVDLSVGRLYGTNETKEMALGLNDFIEGKVIYDSSIIRNKAVKRFGKNAFINNFKECVESVSNIK